MDNSNIANARAETAYKKFQQLFPFQFLKNIEAQDKVRNIFGITNSSLNYLPIRMMIY